MSINLLQKKQKLIILSNHPHTFGENNTKKSAWEVIKYVLKENKNVNILQGAVNRNMQVIDVYSLLQHKNQNETSITTTKGICMIIPSEYSAPFFFLALVYLDASAKIRAVEQFSRI